LSIKI